MTYPGLRKGLQLLRDVLERSSKTVEKPETKNLRRAFINRHAWNVYEIGGNVLFLAQNGRCGGVYLLVRPALESLLKLAAAVHVDNFAEEKMVAEIIEDRKKLNGWREFVSPPDDQWIDLCIRELDAYEIDLKTRYGVSLGRKWSIGEVAKAGKVKAIHARDYYRASAHVHGMMRALVNGADRIEDETAVACMTRTASDAILFTNQFFLRDDEVSAAARSLRE